MNGVMPVNRREFLKSIGVLGGGIVVYVSIGQPTALAEGRRRNRNQVPDDFNAFVRIGADGRITCFTGKVELGQGINASLAQALADELDAPYDSIDMIMGDTDLCPWDRGTHGSMTTRYFGPVLREAAAEARAVLIELAAERLGEPRERLKAEQGAVFDPTQAGKRVTYAELAQGKIIERHVEHRPSLKAESDFRVMGTSPPTRDLGQKVTGRAQYGGDVRLPGLLYARILRPPAHGAKLTQVDTAAAEKMAGVRVVRDGDWIAVLHEHPDGAQKALEMIRAEFERPRTNLDHDGIYDHLVKTAPGGSVESEGGSLETGKKLSAELFQRTYRNGYVAHAPMEPHASTARVEARKVTVWSSTQRPFGIRDNVAEALGVAPDQVRVIPTAVGGGFGGKNFNQEAVEATKLAQRTGRPVQVAWSRAEEFFYDTFRPAAVAKITSGIDASGRIVLFDFVVYMAGSAGAEQFYAIPHHREVSRGHWRGAPGVHPFSTGPWRAPGNNTNTFAKESQIDIMASKAGVDPLEFRVMHLQDRKMRKVLGACAETFGWTPAKTPSGRGVGVACGIRSGAYVATMAEVEVDRPTGRVRVARVACAQDMGFAVNPEGAKRQMEGCITMGLGYALAEEVRFRDGEILDLNFDTYEIPRFSWLPEIETVLVRADDTPPQGGGEPPIICMGAVIANAIYDAVGARLYDLPMTPERVKKALG
jgi:isoquinoline 1-oxidoreductase